jgi:hypothetical protein
MKSTEFQVFFVDGTNMYIYAMNPLQAYVHACSDRANNAKNMDVKMIFDNDHMIAYNIKVLITQQ